MRARVDASLASAAHQEAFVRAEEEHEAAAAADFERILRRYTRGAVASFTRGVPVLVAAGGPPEWRMPIPSTLLDHVAAQTAIDAAAAKHQGIIAASTIDHMSSVLGIGPSMRNNLLRGVIERQAGAKITTAPAEIVTNMMISLQKSYDAGHSIPKAARLMREAGYAHSKYYAERIARTELIGVVNAGSLAAVTAGTTIPYKLWMATNDGRTRLHHKEADGQTVPIDAAFSVGGWPLEYPGDPSGPGEEVIMCRCTMGYTDDPGYGTGLGGTLPPAEFVPSVEEDVGVPSSWGSNLGWKKHQVQEWSDASGKLYAMENKINDKLYGDTASMTPEEILDLGRQKREWSSWNGYIGHKHHAMNSVLRGYRSRVTGPEVYDQQNEYMREFFNEHATTLSEDTQLFRGTLFHEKGEAGTIHTDPAWMSTSLSYKTSYSFTPSDTIVEGEQLQGVMLRMQVPKGTKVLAGNRSEFEYIFEPGTRYLVVQKSPTRIDSYTDPSLVGEPPETGQGRPVYDVIVMPPGKGDDWARSMLAKLRTEGKIQ